MILFAFYPTGKEGGKGVDWSVKLLCLKLTIQNSRVFLDYLFEIGFFLALPPLHDAHGRDPITAFKKYLFDNKLASELELKAIDKKIEELLENVFADPKGFGIGPDARIQNSPRALLMSNPFNSDYLSSWICSLGWYC
ncbi:hypothetical protein PIB30_024128 [Stylosanthes scabra]|uniref:Uncharacterized protein n=1 Tax=Stylosanthes scabra TaxID=79078 RepID=A0ABU6W828_9FABA|nr:hypothetical protein [Stylosanthes scabra]